MLGKGGFNIHTLPEGARDFFGIVYARDVKRKSEPHFETPFLGVNASTKSQKPRASSAGGNYLISTLAPAASTFFLISSASSLVTPSLRGFGAPSTKGFGFRQTESRNRGAHFFDHANLVRAHFLENHVESGLLLGRRCRRASRATGRRRCRHRHRSCCAHAPFFFELLHQSSNLKNGQPAELLHQCIHICHFIFLQLPLPEASGKLSPIAIEPDSVCCCSSRG